MCPTELRPQCGRIWEHLVELAITFQLPSRKASAKFRFKLPGKMMYWGTKWLGAILHFAILHSTILPFAMLGLLFTAYNLFDQVNFFTLA